MNQKPVSRKCHRLFSTILFICILLSNGFYKVSLVHARILDANAATLNAVTSTSNSVNSNPHRLLTNNVPYLGMTFSYPDTWDLQPLPYMNFGFRISSPNISLDPMGRPMTGGYLGAQVFLESELDWLQFVSLHNDGEVINMDGHDGLLLSTPLLNTKEWHVYAYERHHVIWSGWGSNDDEELIPILDEIALSISFTGIYTSEPQFHPNVLNDLDRSEASVFGNFPTLKQPFSSGPGKIVNGYEDGNHTGGDRYALDLCQGNNCTASIIDDIVIAPTNLTLRWTGKSNTSQPGNDFHIFEISADSTHKLCMSMGHFRLTDTRFMVGRSLPRGAQIGRIVNYVPNIEHIHMGLHMVPINQNCAGSTRTAIPFDGNNGGWSLDSVNYPIGTNHDGVAVTSTNAPICAVPGSAASINLESTESSEPQNQITFADVNLIPPGCDSALPGSPSLISPANGQSFNEGEPITLAWSTTGDEYFGEVWGGPAGTTTFGWQTGSSRNIGQQWAGYVYSWRVMARNSFGVSSWSFSPTFVVRPGVPTGLHVSAVSCSQLNLAWSDNSGSEAGYKVYRNGNLVATLSQDTTSYSDSGLSQNTNYSYFVKAFRGNIESNPSNTTNATTTTCSTTPPSLTLSLGSTLKNRPVTIELRYPLLEILGSIFTGSATTDANGNITNFPLTNANPGTAYYVLVKPQGWLRKQEEIILASGANFLNLQSRFDSFSAGDINGNNTVDILDYQILSNTFGGTSSMADLNGDGNVDILDFQYLSNGFGKVGDGGEIPIDGASAGIAAVIPEGQLILVSSSNTPQVGDTVTANLNFNTATLPMAALNAMIAYDQCVLQPLVNQITHSGMFATTAIVSTPGTLTYSAHKWTGVNPGSSVSGSGHVASIPFRVIASVPSSTTLAIRFRPGSTYLSNMARDDIVQPFLGQVGSAVLHPAGGSQRTSRSAQMLSPSPGEILTQDLVLLQAEVSDACNGTHQVTFYAFYNDQWQQVAVDNDGTDGWAVYWDVSQVSDQVIMVKAFAGDFAGNGVETAVNANIILDRQSTANTIFGDIQSNYWALNFIERLYSAGITGGCGVNPLNYCPEGIVTRAQMAVFLERGIHGSSYNPPSVGASTGFSDVQPTYWAAAWIKQLSADGITSGCGGGNYCPEAPVTRAQMAIFLLRAKYGAGYVPPGVGASTGFGDVPLTYWAAAWIKQLATEGITGGCGSGNYCPEAPVTRAQMAVFLVRTFGLP